MKLIQLNCLCLLVLVPALLFCPVVRAETPFLPVTDLCRDSSFSEFRGSLLAAIDSHDKTALISLLSPSINISFGGDNGIPAFESVWFSENATSDIWSTLDWILVNGGRCIAEAEFSAPYVYSFWPNELDPFEHVAIIGKDVNVRAQPNRDSAIVATISHSIVTLSGQTPFEPSWVRVKLDNGDIGYVSRRYAKSPLDYRIVASKRNGAWLITALIAGD